MGHKKITQYNTILCLLLLLHYRHRRQKVVEEVQRHPYPPWRLMNLAGRWDYRWDYNKRIGPPQDHLQDHRKTIQKTIKKITCKNITRQSRGPPQEHHKTIKKNIAQIIRLSSHKHPTHKIILKVTMLLHKSPKRQGHSDFGKVCKRGIKFNLILLVNGKFM